MTPAERSVARWTLYAAWWAVCIVAGLWLLHRQLRGDPAPETTWREDERVDYV